VGSDRKEIGKEKGKRLKKEAVENRKKDMHGR
jgi:hypothetical protein